VIVITDGVKDVILASSDGSLVEGTQTNFFAVIDGAVWTAEENILKGTLRKAVLEVCASLKVPVVLEPPTMAQLRSGVMQGAFISSTSRLVMPIDSVVQNNDERDYVFASRSPVIDRIKARVEEEVERRCVVVL